MMIVFLMSKLLCSYCIRNEVPSFSALHHKSTGIFQILSKPIFNEIALEQELGDESFKSGRCIILS